MRIRLVVPWGPAFTVEGNGGDVEQLLDRLSPHLRAQHDVVVTRQLPERLCVHAGGYPEREALLERVRVWLARQGCDVEVSRWADGEATNHR